MSTKDPDASPRIPRWGEVAARRRPADRNGLAQHPGAGSFGCLSCRDGALAVDQATQQLHDEGAADLGLAPSGTSRRVSQSHGGASFALGSFGSGEHPVGVRDPLRSNGDYALAVGGEVSGLPLFGPDNDRVECETCHVASHEGTPGSLRMSHSGSRLCLACHKKSSRRPRPTTHGLFELSGPC